jgi:hypothetical protein
MVERHGVKIGPELIERTITEFRRERGLYTLASVRAWLGEQGLDPNSFGEMMTREAMLRWTEAVTEPELRAHLVDQLRSIGCYGRLSARARAKQAVLGRVGLDAPDLTGSGVNDAMALWHWYFTDRLGRPVPDDLEAYAHRFGFAGVGALFRAVLLERWYMNLR